VAKKKKLHETIKEQEHGVRRTCDKVLGREMDLALEGSAATHKSQQVFLAQTSVGTPVILCADFHKECYS
jgi:hypothetical protein